MFTFSFSGFSWQDVSFFSLSFTPSLCNLSLRPDSANSRQNCSATISRYHGYASSPKAQSKRGILNNLLFCYKLHLYILINIHRNIHKLLRANLSIFCPLPLLSRTYALAPCPSFFPLKYSHLERACF